ncbi:cyclase family protein [Chachezhania sediminis]|uniref:cyclase family protein n=1 Tax=Chachezhania sediminis TaxID=2599291 RepID=UPI00131E759A|nr:cyclase family protein [Chachezhania sediminis]
MSGSVVDAATGDGPGALPFDLALWQRAAGTVETGRLFELGREFHDGMPHYPTHPDFEVSLFRKHGDRVRGDGASSASCHLSFGGHTGTHIDALCHVSQDGRMHDGSPADNQRIQAGTAVGDAADLGVYVRRGVLFDIAALDRVDRLSGDRVIGPEDLAQAAERQGFRVEHGDVVLIRTGWGQLWGAPGYIDHATPGPNYEAAKWLLDRGAGLVGSDTAVFEKGPVTDAAPVHRLLLFEQKVNIMENLDLEPIAAAGVSTFLFLALPLRVRGGTASPLRPVAIC